MRRPKLSKIDWHPRCFLLLALSGCGGTTPTGPDEPASLSTTYRLKATAGTADLRAVLIRLTGVDGIPVPISQQGVLGRVGQNSTDRALFVGPLAGNFLLQARTATPGAPPIATVLDAAAGSGSAYGQIPPAGVTLTWEPID